MKHYMIDIETMGRGPKAVITEIAVVEFWPGSPDQAEPELRVHALPCVHQQLRTLGRQVDADTLAWWLRQDRSPQRGDRMRVEEIVEYLREQAPIDSETRLWANSPSFDLVILKDYLEPGAPFLGGWEWKYWQERDVRTVRSFLPAAMIPPFEGQKHIAAHDALHQAAVVSVAYKFFNFKA